MSTKLVVADSESCLPASIPCREFLGWSTLVPWQLCACMPGIMLLCMHACIYPHLVAATDSLLCCFSPGPLGPCLPPPHAGSSLGNTPTAAPGQPPLPEGYKASLHRREEGGRGGKGQLDSFEVSLACRSSRTGACRDQWSGPTRSRKQSLSECMPF